MTVTAESVYQDLKNITIGGSVCLYSYETCEQMAPLINEINTLKREKDAVILAHSYVSPEIIYGVADFVGDSYELSKKAKETEAQNIIFVAVKFMAETAKIINPQKRVFIPSQFNGCSLADSITAKDVEDLRKKYPDRTFVCYINTTAEVKALCDVCVTSSNVVDIISAIPNEKIYFLPDKLMGENIVNDLNDKGIQKDVLFYHGTCYVHEAYDSDMITYLRQKHADIEVLSHPECDETVVQNSDFVGSTSQLVNYIHASPNKEFVLLTECGLSTKLQLENPEKKFIGSCTMCKYMKSNSLESIASILKSPKDCDEILLNDTVINDAKRCIDSMFDYTNKKG